MAALRGFWSYVHKDDQAEGGRIVLLARDLKAQYQLLTGEELELFLDKDTIKWGEDWQSRIDDSLSSVARRIDWPTRAAPAVLVGRSWVPAKQRY